MRSSAVASRISFCTKRAKARRTFTRNRRSIPTIGGRHSYLRIVPLSSLPYREWNFARVSVSGSRRTECPAQDIAAGRGCRDPREQHVGRRFEPYARRFDDLAITDNDKRGQGMVHGSVEVNVELGTFRANRHACPRRGQGCDRIGRVTVELKTCQAKKSQGHRVETSRHHDQFPGRGELNLAIGWTYGRWLAGIDFIPSAALPGRVRLPNLCRAYLIDVAGGEHA